jgi:hypothetical protein
MDNEISAEQQDSRTAGHPLGHPIVRTKRALDQVVEGSGSSAIPRKIARVDPDDGQPSNVSYHCVLCVLVGIETCRLSLKSLVAVCQRGLGFHGADLTHSKDSAPPFTLSCAQVENVGINNPSNGTILTQYSLTAKIY